MIILFIAFATIFEFESITSLILGSVKYVFLHYNINCIPIVIIGLLNVL